MPTPSLDLNTADPTGNIPFVPSEFTLGLKEQEAIENMLSIVVEGCLVGDYEGMSEHNGSQGKVTVYWKRVGNWCLSKIWHLKVLLGNHSRDLIPPPKRSPLLLLGMKPHVLKKKNQVSTDPAPSPHFYAEPLAIVSPEMRSVCEEEDEGSEEDYVNVAIAIFICARSSRATLKIPTPKKPTTRLQRKEALESTLKNSKKEKKRRRLMKGGKLVHEKVVPTTLVIDSDDEMEEESSPLIHKSSKKSSVPKSGKESSERAIEVSRWVSLEKKWLRGLVRTYMRKCLRNLQRKLKV
uniref:Uncharacterized protein n=1 Tax=Nicotiana tabacum TaxID=4097 RepID=A0A1S4C7R3_TOBAC|nr:PREDICTED: uncharacterized protein LOC107815996 [Nicotiana tabacum]XP_016497141.1 PREDICTED: uncharacterized protein LOC107815996 [Nicotiana tabacum]XP_016497142.1 PREDICTED: uncharacterized protein LOC107815996 [Nicotiana tabacum]XP_016497143.1 PREDICTED: uncharacterized protein LOC107815996 [Nicotiana tabacum]XP_016497144.1 PREDICTED: uncharacterized protein LOC107815996 [Nicotiana tabacum]XP_016497145.1 PREDICTED: uncharacterized protein LOC107815996 [Nicotiana tabacum]